MKMSALSAAWLSSPSLFLVCIAGGVRDAGGYVFGYYLASYFSPLMYSDPRLVGDDGSPCMFSFNPAYQGDQVHDIAQDAHDYYKCSFEFDFSFFF